METREAALAALPGKWLGHAERCNQVAAVTFGQCANELSAALALPSREAALEEALRITNEQIREAASELTSERMWKRLDKVILENEAALATPAKTPVEPTPSDRKRAQRWIGKNTNGKYGWTDSLAAEFAAVRREAEERKQP